MSEIKWHVRYNPRMHRWRVYDENWYYVAEYKTHTKALAYADRVARTVEVTLPRVGNRAVISDGGYVTTIVALDNGFTWLSCEGNYFAVRPGEVEETALTLLALARRKEQS